MGTLHGRTPARALSRGGCHRSLGRRRDVADAIFAELFGLRERDGVRQSLFRYFHGRSSLSTWLRAVLSQRHVDRVRERRRLEPLPEDDEVPDGAAAARGDRHAPDPERARFVEAMRDALGRAIARSRRAIGSGLRSITRAR